MMRLGIGLCLFSLFSLVTSQTTDGGATTDEGSGTADSETGSGTPDTTDPSGSSTDPTGSSSDPEPVSTPTPPPPRPTRTPAPSFSLPPLPLPILPFPQPTSGPDIPFVLPDFSPCPEVPGYNWIWVVIFIPDDDGEFPSVCLPQEEPAATIPPLPVTSSPAPSSTTTSSTTSPPPPPASHVHTFTEFWTIPGYHFPDYLSPQFDPFYDPFLSDPFFYEAELGWYRSSPGVLKSLQEEQISVAEFQRSGSVVETLLSTMNTKKTRKQNKGARRKHRKKIKHLRKKLKKATIMKNEKQKRSAKTYGVGGMDWKQIQQWRENWKSKTRKQDTKYATTKTTDSPKNIKHGKSFSKRKKSMKNWKHRNALQRSWKKLEKSKNNLSVKSFLDAVVNKYGSFNQSAMETTTIKTRIKKTTQMKNKAHLLHKIRRFSRKNIVQMLKMSNKELRIPLKKVRKPRSVKMNWQRLKNALTRGLRGPRVTGKGVRQFIRTNFVRSLKDLKKQMSRTLKSFRSLNEDDAIATYVIPLAGNENSLDYNPNTCHYLMTGKKDIRDLKQRSTQIFSQLCQQYEAKMNKKKRKKRRKKKKIPENISKKNDVKMFIDLLVKHAEKSGKKAIIIKPNKTI